MGRDGVISQARPTLFQYLTTSSLSVQSLTTIHTGNFCNGRMATSMSPSVAAPSGNNNNNKGEDEVRVR
jgi:hypothetical protein